MTNRASFFAALLASVVLLAASAAQAGVTWSVTASTSDGSPLNNVTVGAQIILDISVMTSAAEAFALAGSVNNYDNTVVGLDAVASSLSNAILVGFATGPGEGFGGLDNQVGNAITFQETTVSGAGVESEFFAGLALSPASGTGALDQGIITGVAGDPQFQVIFDALAEGTTTLQIGTYAEYQDGYTGGDNQITNTTVMITVPEPATIASSLAALGTVLGVVAVRRRD